MRFSISLAMTALTALLTSSLAAEGLGIEFRFERFNGRHENLVAEVEPIRSGPVTIRLTSPEHELELMSNQLNLTRLSGQRFAARAEVRFSGSGSLIAALDFSGVPASLQDRVVFPEQETVVEGTVQIEVVDEGYLVTVEELPGFVDIQMSSALGTSLVAWCSRLALFVAGNAGCDDLDRELSHPKLPLPAPGATQLIRKEELTAEERDRLDIYLASF